MKPTLVRLLAGFGLCLAACSAMAQSPAPAGAPRIGFLSHAKLPELVDAFRRGLQELGYVEGRNIVIEYRWGENSAPALRASAAELVQLRVAAIVTMGSPAAFAARAASDRIPIVTAPMGDPVSTGLARSLARPGGNVTGVTLLTPELAEKRLELLKQMIPTLSRVAVFQNTDNPSGYADWDVLQGAGAVLGTRLRLFSVSGPGGWEDAFADMAKDGTEALIVLPDAGFNEQRQRIIQLAAQYRLPAMYEAREFIESGGLIGYGPDIADMVRRAATILDKILKGANPAELPIEQPSTFKLFINVRTAAALGLTVPQAVLERADEVIE